jgi:hypothetical protein
MIDSAGHDLVIARIINGRERVRVTPQRRCSSSALRRSVSERVRTCAAGAGRPVISAAHPQKFQVWSGGRRRHHRRVRSGGVGQNMRGLLSHSRDFVIRRRWYPHDAPEASEVRVWDVFRAASAPVGVRCASVVLKAHQLSYAGLRSCCQSGSITTASMEEHGSDDWRAAAKPRTWYKIRVLISPQIASWRIVRFGTNSTNAC